MSQMHLSKFFLIAILITWLGFWSACEKVSDEPYFDLSPHIELAGISQDTIREFRDSLILDIYYEDGNGDLGNPDADVNSLFIRDQRLEEEDAYYLSPLAPLGSEISIHGHLKVALPTLFMLGNADRETTVFSLYLIDRAGNQSNIIETQEITLIK